MVCCYITGLFLYKGLCPATDNYPNLHTFLGASSKGWFPYDRGSQTADHNEVCDRLRWWKHTFFDRLRSCDHDRRRSQEIEHGSIFCDRLWSWSQDRRRSQKYVSIWSQTSLRSAIRDHIETSLKDRNFTNKFYTSNRGCSLSTGLAVLIAQHIRREMVNFIKVDFQVYRDACEWGSESPYAPREKIGSCTCYHNTLRS